MLTLSGYFYHDSLLSGHLLFSLQRGTGKTGLHRGPSGSLARSLPFLTTQPAIPHVFVFLRHSTVPRRCRAVSSVCWCLSWGPSGIPGSEFVHILRELRGDPGCVRAEGSIAVMGGMM